jgi:uncharacterized protein YcnI
MTRRLMLAGAPGSGGSAMTRLVLSAIAGLLMGVDPAWAHVTVTPRESRPGITEPYTVRVPTEGKMATVEVELEIPEDVSVSPQASAGWAHALKRTGDRVTSIVWKTDIKPGEFAEFGFIGRNPKTGESIAWKAHQRYANGTASHWIGEPGTRSPAPITTLAAASQDDVPAVTAWLGTYDAAFNAKDLEKLASFYHPDVTIYEGAGINNGWADYRDRHLGPELKAFQNLQFAHVDTKVTMHAGGQSAYATSRYTLKAKMGERDIDSEGLATYVLVKGAAGTWQIRHSHTSSRARRPAAP